MAFEGRSFRGNIMDWNSMELKINELEIIELDKQEVCLQRDSKKEIQGFWVKKNFDSTVRLCRNFGGEMAVAEDRESFTAMVMTYNKTCQDSGTWNQFYSGYHKEGLV